MCKKIITILTFLVLLIPVKNFADPGDSTVVQAFTFGSASRRNDFFP